MSSTNKKFSKEKKKDIVKKDCWVLFEEQKSYKRKIIYIKTCQKKTQRVSKRMISRTDSV